MRKIIRGKAYDTETATLIATNEFSDGSNKMPGGRSTSLYKTTKGNFFALHETRWQGERDTIEPLSITAAKDLFEALDGGGNEYEEVFGEKPEEA